MLLSLRYRYSVSSEGQNELLLSDLSWERRRFVGLVSEFYRIRKTGWENKRKMKRKTALKDQSFLIVLAFVLSTGVGLS